ncbi:MAG: hypothetical protein CMJ18_07150 [Phycisphaeraceae bacterium]|nr:hypothetical protein [Phycisphaeraceae bacterium]
MTYPLDPEYPYTMPTVSVFRDPRPWDQGGMRYGRTTAFTVTFRTETDAASRLLPAPFRLDGDAQVSVSIVQCEDVDWLAGRAYNLIGVDVAAVFDGQVDQDVHGVFCVVMWENMTEPILGGRDHSGVPKVYADIPNLLRHGEACRGSASHFGYPILETAARDLAPLSAARRAELEQAKRDGNWMNLKYFPNATNTGPDVCYACTYPSSGSCPAAWEGAGEIRFFQSSFEKNPTQHVLINLLANLPVLEVCLARIVVWEPFMALDREPRILR